MKSKLRELREGKQWSQSDLADKLGVSRQTINAIETERYDPSLPLAFKVARLFKKPIEDIFAKPFREDPELWPVDYPATLDSPEPDTARGHSELRPSSAWRTPWDSPCSTSDC